jgi:hypothetical protein
MFKSIENIRYDSETDSYIYLLIDSEFECVVVVAAVVSIRPRRRLAAAALMAVAEYAKRNLSVGKNLLLIAKFFSKDYEMNKTLSWQDDFIPAYLKKINYPDYERKWERWKKERDSFLVML